MKNLIILAFSVAVIVFTVFVSWSYLPLMKVNADYVSRREIRRQTQALEMADQKMRQILNISDSQKIDSEIQTINSAIVNRLVQQKLKSEMSQDVLNDAVSSKMVSNEESLKKIGEDTGLSASEIQKFVLVPRAQEEVLKSKLVLGGTSFEEWLAGEKSKAQVKFYFSNFKWNGKEAERK